MKKSNLILSLSILFIFAFQIITSAQPKFEGKVNMKMTYQGESHNMSYLIKGNKIRMEVSEGGHSAVMIFDEGNKKMMMIMPQQNMYMEIPVDQNTADNMDQDNKDVEFTKTGETKTINGYKCEKWLYKSNDDQGVAWMTKELGAFTMFSGGSMRGSDNKPEWMKEIESEGAFPMEVDIKDKDGKDQGKLEVTSVQKESLDASLFTVPSGYKKFEMPGMNSGK